ncbi:MAG: 4Fe-4S dicluster domain-containing protein [Deltaproteobacteria bacterium]|nr:4Fe-4S dicluster domain-containing protein [Deltaproteobacteria bacterium]
MTFRTLEKKNFPLFIENLMGAMEVVGVRERIEGKYEFAPLESPSQLCLDYDVTIFSPKKYILPPRETLLKFKMGKVVSCEPVLESRPLAIVGVHPYDIKGIAQLDRIFAEANDDEHYRKRRQDTVIIGVDIKRASPYAFCKSMNSATVQEGFDLLLTDMGESYVVAVGTKKGEGLLEQQALSKPATKEEMAKRAEVQEKIPYMFSLNTINTSYEDLPKLLTDRANSKLFEELAEKCFSCGSCNLVCPTCYCFDVQDDVNLNLSAGERFRLWDGCLLEGFAKVATGENFREDRSQRIRHRIFRKGKYIYEKYGEHGCVGCGRCASACLPDIANPVEIFNRLKEGK